MALVPFWLLALLGFSEQQAVEAVEQARNSARALVRRFGAPLLVA
jgi:hypothetical protein